MDYGFVSKTGDEKCLTLLVTKDRDSRVLQAEVVFHNGKIEDEAVDQAVENVRRLGYTDKIIVKTDNEPALNSLRNGVLQRLELQAIPEAPPQEESQSNGCMENGVQSQMGC